MGTTEKRIWSHKKIRTRSRNVHWIDVTSFSRKDQSNIDGFASLCILLVTFVGDFFLNYFASFSRFLMSRTWFRGAGGGCGIARRTAQVAQKCVFRAGSGPFRRLGLGGWFQRVILIDEEQKKTSSFEAFFFGFSNGFDSLLASGSGGGGDARRREMALVEAVEALGVAEAPEAPEAPEAVGGGDTSRAVAGWRGEGERTSMKISNQRKD